MKNEIKIKRQNFYDSKYVDIRNELDTLFKSIMRQCEFSTDVETLEFIKNMNAGFTELYNHNENIIWYIIKVRARNKGLDVLKLISELPQSEKVRDIVMFKKLLTSYILETLRDYFYCNPQNN